MSVLNSNSHRQIAAIELNKLEIKFTPNTNFLEVQGEGGCKSADFVATITTPQVINFSIKRGFERIPLQRTIPEGSEIAIQ
uniref:Uncharacterized protein n=1 Tax=Meloidogyne enterolobii TaxID=390850 RepID=A0A6V7VAI1_MELEN|nr:unnamed protein product [Meloidogyne enterolobii]